MRAAAKIATLPFLYPLFATQSQGDPRVDILVRRNPRGIAPLESLGEIAFGGVAGSPSLRGSTDTHAPHAVNAWGRANRSRRPFFDTGRF